MPTSTHDRLVAGLLALGYKLDPEAKSKRYEVYSQPGKRNFYLAHISLRQGTKVSTASAVSPVGRHFIMNAPQLKPLIEAILPQVPRPANGSYIDWVEQLQARDPRLAKLRSQWVIMYLTHLGL